MVGRTMPDLFADQEIAPPQVQDSSGANAPLADRLRPSGLDEIVGQEHLTGPDGAIGRMVAAGKLSSMVLWGPPGTGKTSIARLLADAVGLRFVPISAVFSGVADLKKIFAEAKTAARAGQRTLLFVDEIHRFNRAQQDGFLPYMEDGTILLVGATTENPSFELNAALLSRAQVIILERLTPTDLERLAHGDGRALLNLIEQIMAWRTANRLNRDELSTRLMRRAAKYDKAGEEHYN